MKHIVVVLHECRWAPGAAKDAELASWPRHAGLLDKVNPKLLVMIRRLKRLQFFVAFSYIGVTATREIAAVNVGSCQRVTADAFVASNRHLEFPAASGLGSFANRLSRGIR